ncbi:SUMO-activating enzyme subunit 2 [Armadillidium nasatum]|uniref:SUMO-activating enzyme subunit n=1 Tax=Armadillidium nasatum TaxID=96803 RepID=A0A5N5TLH2_9CRUS|nr:SUMO-activating enzyme subunit 2 [Armadillidium nasatum]
MAIHINGVFNNNLINSIKSCKVLVVGAGGIGCELLKNLVLTGFEDIEVIDLDTIDVSNLNRQFLFQKQHVGKSKSQVARESALRFNPKSNIVSYHDSIISPEYGVSFYKRFTLVMNALDNRTARNHVNRMCLAANIPLIESGSSGYLGQVTVIQKGLTECYECQPKPVQKTFPGCTIRNTPSEPIHCIVWSKHLFNQLFGETDDDEDVSPDAADPEQVGEAGKNALASESNDKGNVNRVSTRMWASSRNYDPKKIFHKLFHDDIQYLLSMDKLWQKRRPPIPLKWDDFIEDESCTSSKDDLIKDQRPWSLAHCREVFSKSIDDLKKKLNALKEGDHLVWDKDDDSSMDFVTACSNIRAYIFGIQQKTRFDVKSMAGNIIPAIATTNAIVAGLIVLQGIKILQEKMNECKTIYLNRKPNPRKRLLVPCVLDKPNPKCYVCSEKPEVAVQLNVEEMTVKTLEEKVLKGGLNMVAPDAVVDGTGTILISSEPGETDANNDKILKDFNIIDGTRLSCDDFLQNYNLLVTILHSKEVEGEFKIVGDHEKLKKEQEEAFNKKEQNGKAETAVPGGSKDGFASIVDDDDDLVCLDDSDVRIEEAKKRKSEPEPSEVSKTKKIKLDSEHEIISI